MAMITGTAGNDRLVGSAYSDLIDGLEGNDQLIGKAGDDTLTGGDGDDRLDGGEGADVMTGGPGDDSYVVDNAGDQVIEVDGEGRDTVTAWTSWTLAAGVSVERLVAGGLQALDLTGNALAQSIYGNSAANVLTGGGGGDNLYGRDGDDTLVGGDGRDVLDGGTGADAMAGGAGDDTYFVDDAGDTVTEGAGEGTDRVVSTVTWALDPAAEVEQLYSRGSGAIDLTGSDTANTIVANEAANVLSGAGGNDRINGRGGDDTLLGGDGDDTLIGGTGADAMAGGAGDDIYYVDDAGDTVIEAAGEGIDLVYVDASWTLGAGQAVEFLVARGGAAIDITGNEFANEIRGNSGANVLSGMGGDDIIHAGVGDTAAGGDGIDTLAVAGATFDLDGLTLSGMERVDLAAGGTALSLTSATAAGFSGGEIRIIGGAGDAVATGDGGWMAAGPVMLDGVLVARFVKDGASLLIDPGVDTTGIRTAPTFGNAVDTGGFTRQVIDLTTLSAAQGFIIQGDAPANRAGYSVASAGDVNGDGFDDLLVGAARNSDGGHEAGASYVVFGRADGFGSAFNANGFSRQVIDLTTLSAADGFVIQGDTEGDWAGFRLSSAGDVNSDGFDDLIIGAGNGDDGGLRAGEAYVVFGHAAGFGTPVTIGNVTRQVIDFSLLDAAQGFIIQGDAASDLAGSSVSSAGDVNGDGYDDLIVGAKGGSDGGMYAGEAYVVFGGPGGFGDPVLAGGATRQVIDLTSLTAAQGFIIQGDQARDYAGTAVSSAGDINGDGFDDLVIGATGGDDKADRAGEAYVVFGGAGGFGSAVGGRQVIDLTELSAAQGFIVQGDAMFDGAGFSVAPAGDVNGDGFADLFVAASQGDDGGTGAGEAYVIFGRATGFGSAVTANGFSRQVIDLSTLSAADGFVIQGDATEDLASYSIAAAGDVNGDGFGDLILGSPRGDDGGSNAGEAYVLFGGASGFGTTVAGRQVIDLTELSAAQGFIIQGDVAGDLAGISVSSAGDVNGDGFADLIVGAFLGDDGGLYAGEAYVLFGGPAGFALPQVAGASDGNDTLTGSAASERLIGGRGDDVLVGNGGADVFVGGEGDDVIDIGAGSFFRIDGGTGNDTLVTTGNLDFTLLDDVMIRGMETIDVTDGGSQTLTMAARDVLAFQAVNTDVLGTAFDNVLIVKGDAADSLHLQGLGAVVSDTVFGGETYDFYAINGTVVLAVDADIMIV